LFLIPFIFRFNKNSFGMCKLDVNEHKMCVSWLTDSENLAHATTIPTYFVRCDMPLSVVQSLIAKLPADGMGNVDANLLDIH
jgi:hypothetical protein